MYIYVCMCVDGDVDVCRRKKGSWMKGALFDRVQDCKTGRNTYRYRYTWGD